MPRDTFAEALQALDASQTPYEATSTNPDMATVRLPGCDLRLARSESPSWFMARLSFDKTELTYEIESSRPIETITAASRRVSDAGVSPTRREATMRLTAMSALKDADVSMAWDDEDEDAWETEKENALLEAALGSDPAMPDSDANATRLAELLNTESLDCDMETNDAMRDVCQSLMLDDARALLPELEDSIRSADLTREHDEGCVRFVDTLATVHDRLTIAAEASCGLSEPHARDADGNVDEAVLHRLVFETKDTLANLEDDMCHSSNVARRVARQTFAECEGTLEAIGVSQMEAACQSALGIEGSFPFGTLIDEQGHELPFAKETKPITIRAARTGLEPSAEAGYDEPIPF